MKSIRIAAVAVLVLATAAFFFLRKGGGEEAQAFRTALLTRGSLSSSVSATGNLGAVTTVQVGTQVSGQVSAIYADFNDHVRKGQLLARIDPTLAQQAVQDAQAGLDRARAGVQQAQADYARNRPLFDARVITAEEFQGYEYKLRVAQADLKSAQVSMQRAQRNLGYTEIYAPIDGIVVERNVDVGQTVAASFSAPQIFLIANDLSKMQILASVDESDIGQIHNGQPVTFTVQSYADRTFRGTVKQVRLQSKTTENVVNYTAVVEVDNDDGKLLPGMTATVDFETGAAQDALLVPNAALRFTPSDDEMKKAGINVDSLRAARAARQGANGGAGRTRTADAGPFGGGAAGGQRPAGAQRGQGGRIWVMDGAGKLKMIRVRTGLTDGKNTVVEGNGLTAGMKVVIGSNTAATASGAQPASNPLGGQQRTGGGPRGGF
ncbi:efflux RND transporter periplasmic adaptor subunit [Longimicrobium sp.]|uniref:efflux RND transporter periplasmic adaptor subunit n=1 Tax=Longimicrobium sp. TaxID=2029185 RepID=UPI002CD04737|nr:efflux RND transporter periplasmic adaptor subunit [Longimicrobium sp.]HSU14405.1 efflux RND transporter periplasmic adaptor subunit [Longimicrobium sp.]